MATTEPKAKILNSGRSMIKQFKPESKDEMILALEQKISRIGMIFRICPLCESVINQCKCTDLTKIHFWKDHIDLTGREIKP